MNPLQLFSRAHCTGQAMASQYTASNAGPGKERKAEMTDPRSPEQRDEQEEKKAKLTVPYPPTVRILLFAGGIALFALVLAWIRERYFRD